MGWDLDMQGFRMRKSTLHKTENTRKMDFPGGPVVRTQCFHCQRPRFNAWSGN